MLYLLRWFWWRITAWCEIVAMLSSFLISVVFVALGRNGQLFSTDKQLLLTISITTICWVAMAYLGPQTDEQTLVAFYLKVKPFGPGWNRIRQAAGISASEAKEFNRNNNVPLALLGWVTGCILIWPALFTVGNFLYGRLGYAFSLLAVAVVCAIVLVQTFKRLWA